MALALATRAETCGGLIFPPILFFGDWQISAESHLRFCLRHHLALGVHITWPQGVAELVKTIAGFESTSICILHMHRAVARLRARVRSGRLEPCRPSLMCRSCSYRGTPPGAIVGAAQRSHLRWHPMLPPVPATAAPPWAGIQPPVAPDAADAADCKRSVLYEDAVCACDRSALVCACDRSSMVVLSLACDRPARRVARADGRLVSRCSVQAHRWATEVSARNISIPQCLRRVSVYWQYLRTTRSAPGAVAKLGQPSSPVVSSPVRRLALESARFAPTRVAAIARPSGYSPPIDVAQEADPGQVHAGRR